MKRKIAFILSIVLACSLVFAVGITTAFAAGDANGVVLQVELENRNYANGDTVKPVVKIANTGANPIVVTGLTCNNNSILPSGGITVGAGSQQGTQPSITASFASGSTTQALNFALAYTVNGTPGPAALTEGIQINLAATLKLTASGSADHTSINAGDKVKFTFKITNSGNVAVTNVSLKASPLNNGAVIGTPVNLNAGDSKTLEWSENINSTIAVKPVITFTANSTNKTQNLSTINVTVKQVTNSGMSVELKADKDTINPGDPVNITATVTNTGGDTLKNIKLLDGNNNPVTLQVTTLNKGQSTTATIPETPQATAEYQFTATGTNSSGAAVNATSNQLTVTVGGASASPSASASGAPASPGSENKLTVDVIADSYTLDKPGNVKFQVTIQNSSDVLLNNVQVTEKNSGKNIGVISALGRDTKVYNPVFTVDKTSQYIFVVTATQPDGKTVTAVTDPLSITVSGGGALFGGDMMTTILIIVIIAIAVVGLILFLLYRRNRSGGGYGGGPGKGSYNVNRKPAPSSYNAPRNTNSARDVEPPRVVRKPVAPAPKPPVRKDTKFGDRNKF